MATATGARQREETPCACAYVSKFGIAMYPTRPRVIVPCMKPDRKVRDHLHAHRPLTHSSTVPYRAASALPDTHAASGSGAGAGTATFPPTCATTRCLHFSVFICWRVVILFALSRIGEEVGMQEARSTLASVMPPVMLPPPMESRRSPQPSPGHQH